MVDNFDKDEFMNYLESEFSGFDNSFLRGTVRNLIDFGLEHHNYSKDQFGYFLSDILPEITFGEVAMFLDDESLTQNGCALKRETAAKFGLEMDGDEALDDLISSALTFSRKDLIEDNPREYSARDWGER